MSFQGVSLIPQAKEEWLKALRSGKYLQAQKALCIKDDGAAYCCLGVFAAVKNVPLVNEDKVEDGFIPDEEGMTRFDFTDRFPSVEKDPHAKRLYDCLLPEEWFSTFFISEKGITDKTHRVYTSNSLQGSLAEMNDDGQSFMDIAKWIEEHL